MGKYELPAAIRCGLACAEQRIIGGNTFVCLADHRGRRASASRHYMVEQSRVEG